MYNAYIPQKVPYEKIPEESPPGFDTSYSTPAGSGLKGLLDRLGLGKPFEEGILAMGTLALAMKKAKALSEAEKYLSSAVKAWEFAQAPQHRLISWFHLKNKMISYREEPFLHGGDLLKSAHNLYLLTGDKKYLAPLASDGKRIKESFQKDFW